MKKVLIISASPRKNGNSQALASAFAKGAAEAGHEVETVSLIGKELAFCRGCMACATTGRCVMRDDAATIAVKMGEADILVFATPVYYYSVCGQLKTMLDRANPLYGSAYRFRQVYLLATAAEDEAHTVSGTETAIRGWVDCFEKATLKKTVFAGGVTDVGDIAGHPALEEAYRLGKDLT